MGRSQSLESLEYQVRRVAEILGGRELLESFERGGLQVLSQDQSGGGGWGEVKGGNTRDREIVVIC